VDVLDVEAPRAAERRGGDRSRLALIGAE